MPKPNPTPPVLDSETVERFWSKVDRNGPPHPTDPALGPCWLWTASTFTDGYGQFKSGERNLKSHRIAHYLAASEWADRLVCHSCDRRRCCNPAHLFVGTPKDNLSDCAAKGRLNTAAGERHGSRTKPQSRARGERVAGAKLTAEQVEEIRRLYATGDFTQQVLGDRFGVDRAAIGFIVRGVNWAHLGVDADRQREIARAHQFAGRRGSGKLNEQAIRDIRAACAAGASYASLAPKYGVSPESISAVIRGKIGSHVV
jgi:hypothetical protein